MKTPVDYVISDFSSPAAMSNFCINADGTLSKREGYYELGNFGQSVRGAYAVDETTYAVIGSSFWKLHNAQFTLIGEMSGCSFESDDEKVSIFHSADVIYIIGGGEFYYYHMVDNVFSVYPTYVPLVTKNAMPSGYGTYNEAVNIISTHRKIEYAVTSTLDYYLPELAESIVSVYLDGSNVPPDFYSLESDGTKSFIRLANPAMITDAESLLVEFVSKSKSAELKKKYLTNVNAFLYSDEDETKLFLYGKNTDGKIFVATDRNGASSPANPCVDYFPAASYFSLVDGNRNIHEIFNYKDNVLAVTSKGTHQIQKKSGSTTFFSKIVSSDFLTTEKSGVVIANDVCYSFSPDGLFTLSYDVRNDAYTVKKIEIPDYINPGRELFTEISLHLNHIRDELWCCYQSDVAVYNIRHKLWYKFTGIEADFMFTCNAQTAFSRSGSVYLFSEDVYTDNDVGFEAVYEGDIYDLGNIFKKKTVFGFGAVIDNIHGATLLCTLKNDKGASCSITISANRKANTEKFVQRVHARLGSCFYITLSMISPADTPPAHIRSILLRYS